MLPARKRAGPARGERTDPVMRLATRWHTLASSLALASGLAVSSEALAQSSSDKASPPVAGAPAAGEAQDARDARRVKLDALFASLKNAGGEEEAKEFVDEIWRLWGQSGRADVDAMMARALGGMQSRDVGLANLLLDEVVDMAPEFAEGWNRRATLRYLVGDHEGSLSDIEKVIALEPRHFGALAGRAMIHAAAERWQPALADYRAALAVNPFLPERLRVLPMLQRKASEGDRRL